jgi:hypothetical protein
MAPVHSNTLKSKLTVVFNTHIKNQGQVVARKVMTLFYLIGVFFIHFYKLCANINVHFLLDYCILRGVWLWSTHSHYHTSGCVIIVSSGKSIVNNPVITIATFASWMFRVFLWFISMLLLPSRMHPLLLHLWAPHKFRPCCTSLNLPFLDLYTLNRPHCSNWSTRIHSCKMWVSFESFGWTIGFNESNDNLDVIIASSSVWYNLQKFALIHMS